MIIILSPDATQKNKKSIMDRLTHMGYEINLSEGKERTIMGAIGSNVENKSEVMAQLMSLTYVENVVPILRPYKRVSRELKEKTEIKVANGVVIGGKNIVMMAGPCAVEGEDALLEVAHKLKAIGVKILRAGAYKPRTSPYSFQGFGEKGLKMLSRARAETGMAIITEVIEATDAKKVAAHADILQIGARNMQNFNLLKACGKIGKPVLLKRGLSATIEEWLLAAEYIAKEGNPRVMLCERGIRTFETYTRNTLDLNAVAAAKTLSHLPVIVDPSHGTGRWELVTPMARAGVAAGADGLLVEAHPRPEEAISDARQTLNLNHLKQLKKDVKAIAAAMGRGLI
ncbi:MAG TPA: 3-deoxy-7-phosphoheptulonate synthase [bacterium]|nr:3-deoxy-7-phosphoheptulonate synthase [bacterium]